MWERKFESWFDVTEDKVLMIWLVGKEEVVYATKTWAPEVGLMVKKGLERLR